MELASKLSSLFSASDAVEISALRGKANTGCAFSDGSYDGTGDFTGEHGRATGDRGEFSMDFNGRRVGEEGTKVARTKGASVGSTAGGCVKTKQSDRSTSSLGVQRGPLSPRMQ